MVAIVILILERTLETEWLILPTAQSILYLIVLFGKKMATFLTLPSPTRSRYMNPCNSRMLFCFPRIGNLSLPVTRTGCDGIVTTTALQVLQADRTYEVTPSVTVSAAGY